MIINPKSASAVGMRGLARLYVLLTAVLSSTLVLSAAILMVTGPAATV